MIVADDVLFDVLRWLKRRQIALVLEPCARRIHTLIASRTADALLPRHQPYYVHLVVRVYLAEEQDKTAAEANADDTAAAAHSVLFSLEEHEFTTLPPLARVLIWGQQPPSYVRFPIVYIQWPAAAQIEDDQQNCLAKGSTTTRLGQWHSEQQHASRGQRFYCFDNVSAQLESATDHQNFQRTNVFFEVNSRAREKCCDRLLALMGQVCKIDFCEDAKWEAHDVDDQVEKALSLVDRRWMKWPPRGSEAQHLDAGDREHYRAEYVHTLQEITAQHATVADGAIGPSVQAMLAFLNTRAPNAAKVKALILGTATHFIMQGKQARIVALFYQSFFDAHQPFGNMAELFVHSFDLSALTTPIGLLPCRSGEWAFHNERTNELKIQIAPLCRPFVHPARTRATLSRRLLLG